MQSFRFLLFIAALSHVAAPAAHAFPDRPIRVIVNSAPGGLLDVTTRVVAQSMGERLGQPLVIDNRAGGDGLLGIRAVKTMPADGYTILASAGTIAIQPAVKVDPGYDLIKDFTPIGPMVRSPLLMVMAPDQPDRSLSEFVSRAAANPNKLSYASAGLGTTTHIGAALFLQAAGLKLLHVPYKGNGAAMPDVMAGRVNMIFEAYGSGAAKVREGRLRALGVSSAARLAGLPEVPTLAEQGYPGFSYHLWLGMVAPAGLPRPVLQRLSEALHAALGSREMQGRFREWGAEAMIQTPAEFGETLKRDLVQMKRLVNDLGIPRQ